MARANTPTAYKCGLCGKNAGHNARTCPTKSTGPSATLLLKKQREEKRAAKAAIKAAKASAKIIPVSFPVIAKVETTVTDDGRPVVDIPPAITKFGEQTYVISGSVRVPCPDDTKFEDIAAFVQYIPRKPSGDGISLFRSKRKSKSA